jgi:anti-sigma factor RsiW
MMDQEAQLRLQAFLDGELPEGEAKQVASWLARDQGAVALLAELRHTRQALAGFESTIRLPESREFYWSKVQREIDRQESAEAPRETPAAPWWAVLRRYLVPATAIALVAVVGLVATRPAAPVPGIETSTTDPGTFTYRDYAGGATLVWLSYPAENEIAENDATGTFD